MLSHCVVYDCQHLELIKPHFKFVTDPEGKYEALEKYGKDLTAMAKAGKLDPVIGRDDEIRRCIQILSRRTKNNPALIGEPGVGKSAISEGYVLVLSPTCCLGLEIKQVK